MCGQLCFFMAIGKTAETPSPLQQHLRPQHQQSPQNNTRTAIQSKITQKTPQRPLFGTTTSCACTTLPTSASALHTASFALTITFTLTASPLLYYEHI